jgi:ribosomal protein S18 acetylase RimI-like enzyme
LSGVRGSSDILAGHRAAGLDRPELWWLAWADDEPAGVVLLTEPPDRLTWDLAYVGVVPAHRQRGVGRALVLHALRAAASEICASLTVAVDVRNTPARRLYDSLGFLPLDTREVLLCLRSWQEA